MPAESAVLMVMGDLEREAESVRPNGGSGDVGNEVIVKVKCCPPITIYSKLF